MHPCTRACMARGTNTFQQTRLLKTVYSMSTIREHMAFVLHGSLSFSATPASDIRQRRGLGKTIELADWLSGRAQQETAETIIMPSVYASGTSMSEYLDGDTGHRTRFAKL